MTKKKTQAAAPVARSATVTALLGEAASVGYNIGASSAEAAAFVLRLSRECKNRTDYLDGIAQLKAGRVVAYFEHPPKAEVVNCRNYVARRWDNLPREQRIEAALDILSRPSPDSDKPNRRLATEHKAVRAADSAVSHLRRLCGLTKASPKKERKPRPSTNPPEGASFTVAAPKVSNDNEAIEFVGNALAALVTFCEKNKQTGAPKSVKQIIHRIESRLIDAKRDVMKALGSGE